MLSAFTPVALFSMIVTSELGRLFARTDNSESRRKGSHVDAVFHPL